MCKKCRTKRREAHHLRSNEESRLRTNENTKKQYYVDKELVFNHYGECCVCCGESEKYFLSLDHINNDGSEHRKHVKDNRLYSWLIKNNFPNSFQALCHNCNHGKYLNGGICPHKTI